MDDAFANIASFLGPNAALPPAPNRHAAAAPAAPQQAAARAAPLLPALEETKSPPRVRAVVFSKDRAFQLRCLLRSLARAQPAEVFVLWRADGETSAKAYASVQAEFPSHRFCYATATLGRRQTSRSHSPTPNLCGFSSTIPSSSTKASKLSKRQLRCGATSACSRCMHGCTPILTWCHPKDAPCAPPATFDVGGDVGSVPRLLSFDRSGLSGDWAYCWDLAGGLYRGADASAVVRDIVGVGPGKDAAAHPNRLEANGNAALRRLGLTSQRPRSACPAGKVCVVVTVNRVSKSEFVLGARVLDASAIARRARRARRRRGCGSGRRHVRQDEPRLGARRRLVSRASRRTITEAAARLRAHRREERGSDDRRCGEIGAGRGGHSRGGGCCRRPLDRWHARCRRSDR